MKSLLKVNAACGYVMETSTHTALFRETLLDNFSSENWKARYSKENYINNGWFVGIINDLEERKKVDEYVAFLVECNDPNLYWKQKQDERRQSTCVSVPLLLSEFYDGGQLFKSKVSVDGVKNDKLKMLLKEIGEIMLRRNSRNIRNLRFEGP